MSDTEKITSKKSSKKTKRVHEEASQVSSDHEEQPHHKHQKVSDEIVVVPASRFKSVSHWAIAQLNAMKNVIFANSNLNIKTGYWDWRDRLNPNTYGNLKLLTVPTTITGSAMFKVGASTKGGPGTQLKFVSCPFIVSNTHLHGLGTLFKQKGNNAKPKESERKQTVTLRNMSLEETNQSIYQIERILLTKDPELSKFQKVYCEVMNGPFLDAILQLILKDESQVDAKGMEEICMGIVNDAQLWPYIIPDMNKKDKALDAKKQTGIQAIINTILSNPMLKLEELSNPATPAEVPEKDDDESDNANVYVKVLNKLIAKKKEGLNTWQVPKESYIAWDKFGFRFSSKAFFPPQKQQSSPQFQQKGALPSQAIDTSSSDPTKALVDEKKQPKSLDDDDTRQVPASSSLSSKEGKSVIDEANELFQEEQEEQLDDSMAAEIFTNLVKHQGFKYHSISYKNPQGASIKTTLKLNEKYIVEGDCIAIEYGVMITRTPAKVYYISLNLYSVIVCAKGKEEKKMSAAEVSKALFIEEEQTQQDA